MSECKYDLDILVDVTKISELLLFIVFSILNGVLIFCIVASYRSIQKMNIKRNEEKADLLKMKRILLGTAIFQLLSYVIEIVGYPYYKNGNKPQFAIFPVLYYVVSMIQIVLLYIACWYSTLIWIQLLYLKKSRYLFLIKLNSFFKRYPIVEGMLIMFSCINLICYLWCINSFANVLLFILSMIILIQLVIVSIFFTKFILNQKAIPRKSRSRVGSCIIGLSIAIFTRIIWSLFRFMEEEDLNEFKQEEWNWFIYLAFYVPIADIQPILLLNWIYVPYKQPESQHILDCNSN